MSELEKNQGSFSELFPQIECLGLRVSVKKEESVFSPEVVRDYSLDSPPPASIRCPGKCKRGKHDMESIIRKAIANGGGEVAEGATCTGRELMGKGHTRECTGSFRVSGHIKLKAPALD